MGGVGGAGWSQGVIGGVEGDPWGALEVWVPEGWGGSQGRFGGVLGGLKELWGAQERFEGVLGGLRGIWSGSECWRLDRKSVV